MMGADYTARMSVFIAAEIIRIEDPDDRAYALDQNAAGHVRVEPWPRADGTTSLVVVIGADDDPRQFELLTSADPSDHLAVMLEHLEKE